jgi:hypothetical protein
VTACRVHEGPTTKSISSRASTILWIGWEREHQHLLFGTEKNRAEEEELGKIRG